MSLGELYKQTLRKLDSVKQNHENHRVEMEYIKMLKEDPMIHNNMMLVRTYEPDDGSMDV